MNWRASLAALCTLLMCSSAAAQDRNLQPVRLPALGRNPATNDDTTALVMNPANLRFLPASELRWSSVYLGEDAHVPWQGHAFAFGFPLPVVPIATGIRFDAIDPPSTRAGLTIDPDHVGPVLADNYQWLTWGLAAGSDTAALGFSLQRSYSDDPAAAALSSWSLGLTSRPFDPLAFALVAHDINGPTNAAGATLDPSYDAAVALRPFSSNVLELGLQTKYIAGRADTFAPGATLGLSLPPLGRLRGDFTMIDPTEEHGRREWMASAALALYTSSPSGSVELAGGSVFGDALGPEARYRAHENVQLDLAFRGWRETSGPEGPRYAVRIRIEDTPGTRGHVSLLRKLWQIAEREPSIDAVVLELRTSPAGSLARTQELRDALHYLRRNGKRVLCHLEDASGSALYLCAAANRILINPAGGVRFAGLRSRHFYLKTLLDNLGIRAQFVRIGKHKSAPEQFTRDGSTDVSRADKIDLLQQHERQYVEGVSAGRQIPPQPLRKRLAKGPFVASEAKAAGLVDGYAYDDQLEHEVSKLVGRETLLLDDERAKRAPEYFGNSKRIALVYVDGDMIDGRSQTLPFLGIKLVGSYTIAETLKQVREDPRVGAVVIRVESPGGSAMAADVMWRQVQLTAKVKPCVVSMGTYAASGGYYVSAPASRIFANPLTITGSIGIFYGKADVAQLMRRIGASVEVYKTAPRADAESIFRPFTPSEMKELRRKVGQFYDVFLSRVATGRSLSKQAVDAVARGRVWTGEQAEARGLVDELGGLRQALAYARQQAGLPEHAPISELPPPDTTLIGRLLGIEGVHDQAGPPLPEQLMQLARALAPFVVHDADKPMARLEVVPITP